MKTFKRREFLKTTIVGSGAVIIADKLSGSAIYKTTGNTYKLPAAGEIPDIVTISGDDPELGLAKLLEPLGGIGSFVKQGQTVGLLVNSPWKNPGYYTRPDVVIALADLCMKAGAKEIICFRSAGQDYWTRGKLSAKYKALIDGIKYGSDRVEAEIPKGKSLKKAEIYKEFQEVDVFISIPVAKHHAGCNFSGNLKGMMGVSSSDTNRHMHSPDGDYTYDNHEYLAQCIADLNLLRKPDLCIVDAIECSINNGPSGPGETVKPNKIIAGKDPLALDVYAASLLGFYADDILTFSKAFELGLGEIDPGKLKLTEL
jgi:uncharacterized protein (DUF362 family)